MAMTPTEKVASLLIFLAPAVVMTIPHGGDTCFFLLFILSLVLITLRKQSPLKAEPPKKLEAADYFIIAILVFPILAVLIGQLMRGDLHSPEFDAPSRILASCAIFFLLRNLASGLTISPIVLIGLGASLGALTLPLALSSERMGVGGRFSTDLSWPNDLGAYAGLLTMITLHLITSRSDSKLPRVVRTLYFLGLTCSLIAGAWVLTGAQSRGPWIAAMLSTGAILAIRFAEPIAISRKKTMVGGVALLLGVTLMIATTPNLAQRIYSILQEPAAWAETRQENSSAGQRLSMMIASLKLISLAPSSGYGDFGYLEVACDEKFKAQYPEHYSSSLCAGSGPHNEILARGLQSGLWGGVATSLLLFGPILIFLQACRRSGRNPSQKETATLGLVIFLHLAIICMFMEAYSIKFTATFNALLLSVLFGELRRLQIRAGKTEESS